MCDRDKQTRHAHSGKNMFRAVCTCARHYSHPTCLHSYELITAVLMMVIFSLSLSSCLFVCFCVSAIPSMLWEAGKQSPVGVGVLHSISHHQGNRAAPSVKLTFPGTIWECVCVCLYGFNIKVNVNTTDRKTHRGFPRKNMDVQDTNIRSSHNSEESDDNFWYTVGFLSFRCWSVSLLAFLSCTFITDLQRNCFVVSVVWTIAIGFSVASYDICICGSWLVLLRDPMEIHNGTIIVYHTTHTQTKKSMKMNITINCIIGSALWKYDIGLN